MSVKLELAEIKKALLSPGGLQDFGPYLLLTLFTHPQIVCRAVKDINDMADKFVFFIDGEVVFVLSLPWNTPFLEPNAKLTEQYKFLLEQGKDDSAVKLNAIKKILKDDTNG